MQMRKKAQEHTRNLTVPFAPVVSSGLGAEFESEVARCNFSGKSPAGLQQRFRVSRRYEEKRHSRWIRCFHKHEWIDTLPELIARRPKHASSPPPLPETPGTETTMKDIDGRTNSRHEIKQLWMPQCDAQSSKSAHGNSNQRLVRSARGHGEACGNIRRKIVKEVILVAIFRVFNRVHVIRGLITLNQHQNQSTRRPCSYAGII